MGEVWLAYDERLQRLVAVKRVRPDAAEDASRRERFRREARLAARFHHVNVVQVFDLMESAEGDALVMEYVEGRSLEEVLREGRLGERRAVELAAGIARGLAAAHQAGLVHRDLKSGNVLVARDGEAKVLDFGLARPMGPDPEATLTGDGDLLGTAHALSPEQVLGDRADARSDLFALGGLLYEMLGGEPPFRGATLTETLHNVVTREPRSPLAELRPGLAPELGALVGELLAKEPAKRPPNAARVAERLQAIAVSLPPDRHAGPTASELDERPTLEALAESSKARRRRAPRAAARPSRIVAALAAATLFLAVAIAWWRGAREPEELRVVVATPTVEARPGAAADGGLLAVGVKVELQRGLLALEGLSPVDPSQLERLEAGPVEVARAVGADEVLAVRLDTEDGVGLVTLRRLRASDGEVLAAESVPVPTDLEDALIMSNAVTAALGRAYPGHRPRAGAPGLDTRPEDYAELVRIERRFDRGEPRLLPDLERLEEIAVTSPRFVDAHVRAAQVALSLYLDTKDPDFLERSAAAVESGRSLAAAYPPLLQVEIRLALAEGDQDRAERRLAALEAASPGDLSVPQFRARVAEARGRLDEAIAVLRSSLERRVTWRGLIYLADCEYRAGEIGAARAHLEEALELVPNHDWPLAKLARLELFFGDPERAGELYERLVALGPHRSDLTNLGLVRYLLGDYAAAAESYRRALELGGEHLAVTLNLADAELALGRHDAARRLYERTLEALEELERMAKLRGPELTTKAQCLVRLGREQAAVELAIDALREHPDEAEVLYQAALVFALAGDEASALGYAKKALELGYQPRWFTIPGFEALTSREAFRRLLEAAGPERGLPSS